MLIFFAYTDGLINEAASLLKAALDLQAPAESAALFAAGPAFLAEVMGLFEYNNIDVEVTSPLGQFFSAKGQALLRRLEDPGVRPELALIERLLREKEWVMRCVWGEETTGNFAVDGDLGVPLTLDGVSMMEEDIGDLGDAQVARHGESAMAQARADVERMSFEQLLQASWPAFHGTALFIFVARCNHSCAPHVKLLFPGNSARLTAVALTPLSVGEELCISYIRQDENVQTRRKQLLEWYGFVCSCPRCCQEDSVAVRRTQKRLK